MCNQQRLRSACAYAQSDQSLCELLQCSASVQLLSEHHLESLSLNGCCTGLSESSHVEMPHCCKSHVAAHFIYSLGLTCSARKLFFLHMKMKGTDKPAQSDQHLWYSFSFLERTSA